MLHDEGGDLYQRTKILDHSNIKKKERYAKLARQQIARTSNTAREMWKVYERATPKVKLKAIDVRVLYVGEIFTRSFAAGKLLKGMVARDGIEPPTPAFSGPRSTN
jgi:hypothetical protein